MRTHPPALRKLVARTLVQECRLKAGERLLLAVSGGPDSMALLHVLGSLRAALGFSLVGCGVNHGLRAAAAAELELAQQFASALDVPFVQREVVVEPGGNLHARAREARYAALEGARVAVDAAYIVTAHHADDRAETVLLRLLRGTRPGGLAVLQPRQGVLLRPMIRAHRTQIQAHLERHGVRFATDPSNLDPRFLRTRVRQELLPLLTDLSPGIVGHLTSLADEVAESALPTVHDERGVEVQLSRAQRDQLRGALRHRSARARVLLSGGRCLMVDPRTGEPHVIPSGPDLSPPGSAKLRPVGSKTSKSS
jgi:tRNA(Ile)-lysidine synthase